MLFTLKNKNMKKQILLSGGILISGLLGAQISKQVRQTSKLIPAHVANMAIPRNLIKTDPQSIAKASPNPVKPYNPSAQKTSSVSSVVIGKTFYDLQSNSSVADRIVVNADGSIAAVWTMELTPNDNTYPTRGTGYAYFNGTTWSAQPTSRVENTRVGWGNIIETRSGKELILSHDGTVSKLKLAQRPAKGTGAWTEAYPTAIASATTGGNFWPRAVTSGDTIYTISVTSQTVTVGAATFQGLNGAVCFSRSRDAGVTWDIANAIPTGLDNTKFLGFGGDSYAIAAKGSTVAIVAGDAGKHVVLCKSIDGGTTWTATTVLRFPINKWNTATTNSDINSDAVADTVETNDGTFSVGLDNTNKAYVFYGRQRVLCTTPGTGAGQGMSYFPGTDGLMMWKEGFAANTDTGGILVAAIEDLGQKGRIFFPQPAVAGNFSFGLWGNSLTSYPSVAFDATTIYLSYSSIVDSLSSLGNAEKLVRHQYVIKSSDGGITWSNPCDIVGSPGGTVYEGILGSMAKRVNGSVHIIYQRDLGPGNGIPGANVGDNKDEGDNVAGVNNNDIVYFKFPVSEIGACVLNVGIKEQSSIVAGLKFYPNPTSVSSTLEVNLNDNSKIEVSILNSVGQVVFTTNVAGTSGNNTIDLNISGLSNGLYFYQVKAGNTKTITNKFVVSK